MERALNVSVLQRAMDSAGFNQSKLADVLDVSREIVSQWMKGQKFPRPDKLLRLGIKLGLPYEELVVEPKSHNAPIVAFRKKGTRKTLPEHIQRAEDMGLLLENLVPYLPYDKFEGPSTLSNPVIEYSYLNDFCAKVRKDIGVGKAEAIDFRHLIDKFNELKAILIPVLWGAKENHENALHIYLPASMTTWVYINLDTNVHDFKFWMAHELGHVYSSPKLQEDEAEDFADAFAETLLFPKEFAENAYNRIRTQGNMGARINISIEYAEKMLISPNTVIKAVNKYSEAQGLAPIEWGKYYGAITNFNKRYKPVSEALFNSKKPSPAEYIKVSEEIFKTEFFRILRKYFKDREVLLGFLQNILQMPILDSKALIKEL